MPANLSAYTITAGLPAPSEHWTLRRSAGLTPPLVDPESPAYSAALARTVHAVIARNTSDGTLVGMVRLIGDGLLMCQICDMAVHPDHQRKGLGRELLGRVTAWVEENCPNGYVSLIGDPPGQAMYKSMGFVKASGIGMWRPTIGYMVAWAEANGYSSEEAMEIAKKKVASVNE